MPTKKKLTHAQLKKKVDEWFSKYIRWQAADENGYANCFTCGKSLHVTQLQAGHFVSRRYAVHRWEPDNVRPQCVADNIFGQGEQWIFGRNIDMQQPGRAEELMRTKDTPRKYTIAELRNLYDYYRTESLRIAERKNVTTKPREADGIRPTKGGKERTVKRRAAQQ